MTTGPPQQPRKVMTVSAEEFIRRFLQHALPSGFQRIHYCGFLANCHRAAKLDRCRRLCASPYSGLLPHPPDYGDFYVTLTGGNLRLCPHCGIGILSRFLSPPRRQTKLTKEAAPYRNLNMTT